MRRLVLGLGLGAMLVGVSLTPLHAQNATFTATGGFGEPGSFVDSLVLFDTMLPAQGWSLGLCNEAANLDLLDAVEGSVTLTVNMGGPPDFVAINPDPANGPGVTMGVVVNFLGMATLPVSEDAEILVVSYEMIGMPEGDESIFTDVCFCDTLGEPPVQTTIVFDGGASEFPDQVCGTFEIGPPPEYCIQNLMCIDGLNQVMLTWEICQDFDYIALHRDGELLELLDGTETSYLDPIAPGTYFYYLIGVAFPEPMGNPEIREASCSGTSFTVTIADISPTVGYFLGGDQLTITGTGFEAAMDTTVQLGGMECQNLVVVDDTMLTCDTPAATSLGFVDVTVMNSVGNDTVTDGFLYGFIRGEINADGDVNIADAVAGLEYLFIGGAEPICLDSVDCNDDGVLGIEDSIYLLTYLFALAPEPLPPFPEPGLDPTDGDPLGCL